MKKVLIGLVVLLLYNCSTTKNKKDKPIFYDYADKISTEQLTYIKNTYNWNDENILIIDYIQPIEISPCKLDYKFIPESGKEFRKKFYSKINTEGCLTIQVFASGELIKSKLDNITYFDDKDDFLYENYFSRKKSCFGILVINNDGYYIQYNGHNSERQVAKFIENLRT